jgi:hypothetical protein
MLGHSSPTGLLNSHWFLSLSVTVLAVESSYDIELFTTETTYEVNSVFFSLDFLPLSDQLP